MGVGHSHRLGFACFYLYGFHRTIHDPVSIISVKFFHVIGARHETSYRYRTIGTSLEGRSRNRFCAGSIRVDTEAPTG